MNYTVNITAAAEHDMANAADYIEFALKNPSGRSGRKTKCTFFFSKQFPLVDDILLNSWGIHFTQVKNYLAFYVISEENHTVTIVRFLYEKSNWRSILKQGFSLI